MDISFDRMTQMLVFKPIYLETMDIITIWQNSSPIYVIDPNNITQDDMINYWDMGLYHLFDVVNI